MKAHSIIRASLRRFTVGAALSCAGAMPSVCLAAPATADATSADDNSRLRALFRDGVKAFEQGKNEEAVRILSEAWSIRQTYDVAASLAQAEIQLKRYRDAAEHLEFGLSHFAPVESEQTLEQMRAAFADVKTHVATLKIQVNRPGAEIQIDGRALGASALTAPQFVDAGVHTVQASSHGENASVVISVDAGGEYPVELRFNAASAAGKPNGAAVGDAPGERSLVPVIVAGTVAVVGTAGLIGFGLAASSDAETLAHLKDKNGPSGCADGTASPSDCSAQLDAAHSHDTHRNLAVASAVVGAVAVVAIPIYWFWPRARHPAEAARPNGFRVRGAVGLGRISVFGEF
ncbi:MAG TPA: PEGA domain-containing protein [Polyangiaceae bacterium]|nr:PEGA domain-containing protein [Polyangiaceae bacterium]